MSVKEQKKRTSTVPVFSLSFLMPKYWPTWFGLLLFYCLSWMPAKILDVLANKLGDLAARKNKKRFNIARTNLSLCFPEKTEEEIEDMLRLHFRAQARAVVQYALLWWKPAARLKKHIEVTGFEQIEAIKEKGGNVIIMLCHSVSLDVAVNAICMRFKSSGPYKAIRNPVLNWLIANRRLRFGGSLFTREDGLRPLIKSVKAGQVLVYLADEDLGADKSIFVPFYGVQKATIPVLGRLARTTRSTVFTCISCYDNKRSRYVVTVLPQLQELTGEDDLADSRVMNESIEHAINLCPAQYLWTFRFFQTRPEGEPSVYKT